jgi:glutathione S-transferase
MSIPELELISHNLCPYVQRAIITLLEKEIPHQLRYIDLADKPEWFRSISPLGKVPLLKVKGEVLFESAVICEFLDEITPGSLHPSDPLIKAKHRAWIEFGSSILNAIAGFYNAPNQKLFEQKQQELRDKFLWIENHWQGGKYFAGDTFSLVDGVYGPIFRYFEVFDAIADFRIFADTPKVKAWRQSLKVRPSIQKAVIPSYPEQLLSFLKGRNSYLSTLISNYS